MSLFPVVSRCLSLFLVVFLSFYNRFSSFLVVVSLFSYVFIGFIVAVSLCLVVFLLFLAVSSLFLVVFSLFLVVLLLFSCCFLISGLLGRRLALCRRRFGMFPVPVQSWEGLSVDPSLPWAPCGALFGTIFGLHNRFLVYK